MIKYSRMCGRKAIHIPQHPKANNRGYVLYSRYLVEKKLGRYLQKKNEHVHHKDGNKHNDTIDNLEILSCAAHMKERWRCGTFDDRKKCDYARIKELMDLGYGYRRIARKLGYKVSTTKAACRRIRGRILDIDGVVDNVGIPNV